MGLHQELLDHAKRRELIEHPFFADIESEQPSKEDAATFIGQWWHPLAYFPYFLSRLISVSPMLEVQTATADILNEELGEGDPGRAHARLFISTMTDAGFDRSQISEAPRTEATHNLVEGYERASGEFLSGLGFLYGTETADLAMVSGIGRAVSKATGHTDLPWVDIHVEQEPGHVDNATDAVTGQFSEDESAVILESAKEMWSLWIDFFSELRARSGARAAATVA